MSSAAKALSSGASVSGSRVMICPSRVARASSCSASSRNTMSRSVTMPSSRPCSTTITAPMRRSRMTRAASSAVAVGGRQQSACSPSITPGMILRFTAPSLPLQPNQPDRALAPEVRSRLIAGRFELALGAFDAFQDQLVGALQPFPPFQLHPFVRLEILVVLEEVCDPGEVDLGEVLVSADLTVDLRDLVDRHRQELFVHPGLVLHLQHADGAGTQHRP